MAFKAGVDSWKKIFKTYHTEELKDNLSFYFDTADS